MKNVTITLEDDLVSRARVEAAKEGKSLSRFVSELVERRVGRKKTQLEALQAFLAGPLMDLTDENGRAPSRDEIYDDALLRRHERPDLHEGPEGQAKAGNGHPVADRTRKA
jgi:predicted CopG family antitoxin